MSQGSSLPLIFSTTPFICDGAGNYTDPYGDALGTSFFDGGPVTFTEVSSSATPEPGTAILMLVGFGMMIGKRFVQWSQRTDQDKC
jgi:hypothetical protein